MPTKILAGRSLGLPRLQYLPQTIVEPLNPTAPNLAMMRPGWEDPGKDTRRITELLQHMPVMAIAEHRMNGVLRADHTYARNRSPEEIPDRRGSSKRAPLISLPGPYSDHPRAVRYVRTAYFMRENLQGTLFNPANLSVSGDGGVATWFQTKSLGSAA